MMSSSSSRDVFPFEAERGVIKQFLRGRASKKVTSDWLAIDKGNLVLTTMAGKVTLAWFATDGTLYAKMAPGHSLAYSQRAINHIMTLLGEPDKQVVRDAFTFQNYESRESVRWFFDGAPIESDQPVILCGPVGILAYRASK